MKISKILQMAFSIKLMFFTLDMMILLGAFLFFFFM